VSGIEQPDTRKSSKARGHADCSDTTAMRWMILLVPLAGCFDLDFSSDSTTITATASEAGTTHVTICGAPSGLLDCNDQESYQVTVGDESAPATEGFLSFGILTADFSTGLADTPIEVSRSDGASGDTSLPAPFTLTGTTNGHDIVFAWDSAGGADPMAWSSDLGCNGTDYFGKDQEIADSGSVTISTDDLPDGSPGTCNAAITVTRSRHGELSSGFQSGTIVGAQARVFTFQLQR
jgi:hypothetical protein